MKYPFLPLVPLLVFTAVMCRSQGEPVSRIGIEEGWQDDTRYVVVASAYDTYNNEPAKYAAAEACRLAEENVQKRFSEAIVGGDLATRCNGVDPAADSYCDWNYRLNPMVFTFRGVELKRRHAFFSLGVFCEIAHEYRHPDLRGRAEAYAARFNMVQPEEQK